MPVVPRPLYSWQAIPEVQQLLCARAHLLASVQGSTYMPLSKDGHTNVFCPDVRLVQTLASPRAWLINCIAAMASSVGLAAGDLRLALGHGSLKEPELGKAEGGQGRRKAVQGWSAGISRYPFPCFSSQQRRTYNKSDENVCSPCSTLPSLLLKLLQSHHMTHDPFLPHTKPVPRNGKGPT